MSAKPSTDHRWRRRSLWLLPLLLGGVGASIYGLSALRASAPEVEVEALSVETTVLEPVTGYTTEREYTGELSAQRKSDLGFERPGTVVALLVDAGDRVSTGQPLARLDIRTLQAQRQQLTAQLAQAQAQLRELNAGPRREDIAAAEAAVADIQQQLELARLQRQRRQDLYAEGAISLEELDQQAFGTNSLEYRLAQAQSQLDELVAGTRVEQVDAQGARVRQLQASIQAVDVDLDKSVLYAPFDGQISDRALDEGVVVGGGQTVFSLIEAGPLEARVGVPAEVADTLTIGDTPEVLVGDQRYGATITALLPELDATSRTATVVLKLESVPLTVGQTARLLLAETEAESGFWLPATALVPGERGLWSVYVLETPEANQPADLFTVGRRDVEVIYTEGDRVLVRGTVQGGDRAITSGTHRVVPGETVRINGVGAQGFAPSYLGNRQGSDFPLSQGWERGIKGVRASNEVGAQAPSHLSPASQADSTSGLLHANAEGDRYGLRILPLSPPPLKKGAIQNLDGLDPLLKGLTYLTNQSVRPHPKSLSQRARDLNSGSPSPT
ncbi:MAG: efflux RND transporter periplasmic adaptor subunit, partial [Leptolyngbya sp. RL_3_1]|nr:efflux RND transporter periplasmic adaptor subunit [Leptolyngbya sp. RL_3_1]